MQKAGERAWAAMERELFVSTGGGICVCALSGEVGRQAALEGAGALCAAKEHLLCACGYGREIFRLDRRTLMPQAVYPGGPGVCELRLSRDGTHLLVLCGDADSVISREGVTDVLFLYNANTFLTDRVLADVLEP